MKWLMFSVCVYVAQVQICSSQTLIELYPPGQWELSDEDVEMFRDEVREYEDISSQAYDDFVNLATEFKNNAVVSGFIVDLIVTWLPSRLNAHHSMMEAKKVQKFFNDFGNPTEAHIKELENMLSKKLPRDRLTRVMTFFKGFRYGATLDETNAALTYFYGATIIPTTRKTVEIRNQTAIKPTVKN